jgi:predicted permease
MALMLLVGSGLLARSFSRMIAAEIGFDPANVMTFRVTVPSSSYPENAQVVRFQQDLIAKLAALPFVKQASAITGLPMANPSPGAAYEVEGHPVAAGQLPPMLHYQTVAPGAFGALGIKLFQGRDFETRDLNDHSFSIVVNRALADHYWPGQDPIGKRLRPAGGDGDPPPWLSVVGVVDSVRDEGIRKPARPLVYFPINPRVENRALSYVVRGDHVTAQADALRKTVWALDGDLPVAAMQSMDEVVEKTRVQFSFAMITLAIAAGMALVLGAIGLYGVLSYAVSLRTREIGVRLALGASPSRVMRATVASGAAITAIGLALGLAGAAAFSRFLSGILYETPPLDPATFAAMAGALFVVALAASYLPARKAALVSPLESMRTD